MESPGATRAREPARAAVCAIIFIAGGVAGGTTTWLLQSERTAAESHSVAEASEHPAHAQPMTNAMPDALANVAAPVPERSVMSDAAASSELDGQIASLTRELDAAQVDLQRVRDERDRYDDERHQLRRTNWYLVMELAPYLSQEIVTRPAFEQLSDPQGEFELMRLQFELVDFVKGHPIHLSDGEMLTLAPEIARFTRDRADCFEKRNRIEKDKTLDEEKRSAESEKERLRLMQLIDDFHARLAEVLGDERAALFN